jgi:hypothetical protein
MRQLIFGTILFLAVCPVVFGQTEANNCPEITILGPSGITNPGDIMTYTASINNFSGTDEIKYEWSVSAGTIEKGQGTPSITVRSTKEMVNSNVTATLKVLGFSAGCKDTASEMGSVAALGGCGAPMDEFGRLSRDDVKARIDNLYIRLNNDPEAEGFILIELNAKESRALKLTYVNSFYDGILFRKHDPSRVTFMVLQRDYDTGTKLWLVPVGADFPEVGESPILIKGEDFKQKIKDLFPKK